MTMKLKLIHLEETIPQYLKKYNFAKAIEEISAVVHFCKTQEPEKESIEYINHLWNYALQLIKSYEDKTRELIASATYESILDIFQNIALLYAQFGDEKSSKEKFKYIGNLYEDKADRLFDEEEDLNGARKYYELAIINFEESNLSDLDKADTIHKIHLSIFNTLRWIAEYAMDKNDLKLASKYIEMLNDYYVKNIFKPYDTLALQIKKQKNEGILIPEKTLHNFARLLKRNAEAANLVSFAYMKLSEQDKQIEVAAKAEYFAKSASDFIDRLESLVSEGSASQNTMDGLVLRQDCANALTLHYMASREAYAPLYQDDFLDDYGKSERPKRKAREKSHPYSNPYKKIYKSSL